MNEAIIKEVADHQYNEIVRGMLNDEQTMLEVNAMLHAQMPMIDFVPFIRCVMTGNEAERLRARAVLDEAIQMAAINRARILNICQRSDA